MKIAAIGDNCIDIYTNKGWMFPGGGPVNFAVHVHRLGADAAYIGVIGNDHNGDIIAQALQKEGVNTTFLMRREGKTAVAFVELTGTERTFIGKDRGVREQLSEVLRSEPGRFLELIQSYDLVHTTLDGVVDEQIPTWWRSGIRISYDYSHRATEEQIALLPFIEVAFFSGQKYQKEVAPGILKGCLGQGCKLAVMTLGERGSAAYDGKQLYWQEAVQMEIVDTLGAGDSFQAGFIYAYLQGLPVQECLRHGALLAAKNSMSYGGFGYCEKTV